MKVQQPARAAAWVAEEKEHQAILQPADDSPLLRRGQGEGHTYGRYTERAILMWTREMEKLVVEGSRTFHDAGLLGSTDLVLAAGSVLWEGIARAAARNRDETVSWNRLLHFWNMGGCVCGRSRFGGVPTSDCASPRTYDRVRCRSLFRNMLLHACFACQ